MSDALPRKAAPLVFHLLRAEDNSGFTWHLLSAQTGEIVARGAKYEKRGEAKEALRLIVKHAGHAQMEDHT